MTTGYNPVSRLYPGNNFAKEQTYVIKVAEVRSEGCVLFLAVLREGHLTDNELIQVLFLGSHVVVAVEHKYSLEERGVSNLVGNLGTVPGVEGVS